MNPINVETEKAEIERLMLSMVQADNDKDLEKLVTYSTNDVIAHMQGVPEIVGIKEYRRISSEFMTETGFMTFDTTRIELSKDGSMAYLTGVYTYASKDWRSDSYFNSSEVEDEGQMLVVWRNTEDGWKVAAMTSMSGKS